MEASYVLAFAFAFGIGIVAGLRSLLAPAAVAWAVRFAWLNLHESPFAFIESNVALVALSLLSLGELVADLLPWVPKRTALLPLIARLFSGGFCGACLCASANQSVALGVAFGEAGAIVGAFAGYEIRRRLVTNLKIKDFIIALSEDGIAIGLAVFLLSR
jgi:uncharacterized membrane protein